MADLDFLLAALGEGGLLECLTRVDRHDVEGFGILPGTDQIALWCLKTGVIHVFNDMPTPRQFA
jgi:hypothetical protein